MHPSQLLIFYNIAKTKYCYDRMELKLMSHIYQNILMSNIGFEEVDSSQKSRKIHDYEKL